MNHSQYAGGDEPTILNYIDQLFSLASNGASINRELADHTEGSLAQLCQLGIIKYETKKDAVQNVGASAGVGYGGGVEKESEPQPHTLGKRLEKLVNLLQANLTEAHTINQATQFMRLNLSRQTDLPPHGTTQA